MCLCAAYFEDFWHPFHPVLVVGYRARCQSTLFCRLRTNGRTLQQSESHSCVALWRIPRLWRGLIAATPRVAVPRPVATEGQSLRLPLSHRVEPSHPQLLRCPQHRPRAPPMDRARRHHHHRRNVCGNPLAGRLSNPLRCRSHHQ